jgi:hypothetical protein
MVYSGSLYIHSSIQWNTVARTVQNRWENGGNRVDITRKTKEKMRNMDKILGKIKTLRTPWRGYAEMLHRTFMSYPQLIHTIH